MFILLSAYVSVNHQKSLYSDNRWFVSLTNKRDDDYQVTIQPDDYYQVTIQPDDYWITKKSNDWQTDSLPLNF